MSEKRIATVISKAEDFQKECSSCFEKGFNLALLLDYDGTLAPIASNPSKTQMPVELEETLRKLAKHPKTFVAVISGRALKDVKAHVNIEGVTFAGNHGLEIEYPDGSRHDYELPADIKQNYMDMVQELKQRVERDGAWVEDKHVSLTYHYRDTPVELKPELKQLAMEICQRHGFRANLAHEAIEAKPPVDWHKGEAALYILKDKFGKYFSQEAFIIFAGDDTTDEDAMRALQGLGRSFRISADEHLETFADYRLPQQTLMTDLFKWIANGYLD
ncbi:CG5171 [Drosophila busckii]|uniref:Trehalose 6-phosphate phosphatase n=1 Tax=Drosophila busckii TaxID=30019 RepID=A0A0M5J3N0_DROBS|nr:trehalose-phosphate phosphatase [Drosophila busckii]ALC38818.1 CG5171 [Drosophila busckii]